VGFAIFSPFSPPFWPPLRVCVRVCVVQMAGRKETVDKKIFSRADEKSLFLTSFVANFIRHFV